MKSVLLFAPVFGLVLAGAMRTAQAQSPKPNEPPPRVTAFGKVVDPAGKPVIGATVYLRKTSFFLERPEPYEANPNDILAVATTDAEGAFKFQDVPCKSRFRTFWRDVVVVAKQYAIAWEHLSSANDSTPLVIRLAPEAKVAARITDQKGQPIASAEVKVSAIESLESEPWSSLAYVPSRIGDMDTLDLRFSRIAPVAKTGADGRATLAGLPGDARLILSVSHDDFRTRQIYVATTDQSEPDLEISWIRDGKAEAESVKVHSNSFSVALGPPTPRLVGRITAADTERPFPQARVSAWCDCGSHDFLYATTDADGRFVFRETCPPRYRLQVSAPKGSDYLGRLLVVDLPKEEREVRTDVELARGETISGLVVDEAGKGVSGVGVAIDMGLDFWKSSAGGPLATEDTTDGEGHFRLIAPPGKRKLRVFKSDGHTLNYDLPRYPIPTKFDKPEYTKELDVVAGKPIRGVKFTVRHETPLMEAIRLGWTRTLEGKVTDSQGKPVASAEVSLLPSYLDPDAVGPVVLTGPSGRFSLTTDDYSFRQAIVAVHKKRKLRGHWTLPEGWAEAPRMTPVEVGLLPTGTIAGRVLEKDRPIAGARVVLHETIPCPGSPQAGLLVEVDRATTDEAGRFRFPFTEADKDFHVMLEARGYTDAATSDVRVGTDATREIDFSVLRADKSVSGIVVDPDGKPVEGMHVSAAVRRPDDWGYVGSTTRPTRKNGRFRINGVPNVPLTLTVELPATETEGPISTGVSVDAEPGQTNVRIVFDPKSTPAKK